jgi:Lipoprotein LpqB beta-propeller domain/Sporulation and spore germination
VTAWRSDERVAGARRPGPWRPGAGGWVASAAVTAAIAAGGCAAVPTSGAVQQFGSAAPAGGSGPGFYSQPIVQPPGPGWLPAEIVEGFIAANASYASNPEVAREYLDPTAQKTWNPRWAVNIVSSWNVSPPISLPKQVLADQPTAEEVKVVVTTLRVGTLTETGQRVTSSGPPTQTFTFTLAKSGGQWRISHPPQTLLLTPDEFKRVYQPRNLYFLSGSGRTLVPDPVFVPEPDTTTQLVTGLATALLQNPGGWLGGAAVTGFPAKSTVIGVKINGPVAIVDLGGKAAAAAGQRQQEQMAAQLAWTLASGPPSIQAVELEVNGRPLQIRGVQQQLLNAYNDWMPATSAGSSLYYIGPGGTVRALSGIGPPGSGYLGSSTPVTGTGGTPHVPPLRSIAVSPDGRWIAGISTAGNHVYTWDLAHKAAPVRDWTSASGTCTSLSWDQQGDLWITAGGSVWLLPPGKGSATPVSSPADSVTSFQVAPDGVRAVMILSPGATLQLVAIDRSGVPSFGPPVAIGSGITDPESLSWYDANDVIVLDGSSGGQLWEVPLNGGAPSAIASQGNIVSVTATNPSGPTTNIAVGLANGQIMISSKLGAAFGKTGATGQAPAYPG